MRFFGLRGTLGAVEHSYGVIAQNIVRACRYGKKQFGYTRVHGEQKRENTIIKVYGIRKRAYTVHAAVNVLLATFSRYPSVSSPLRSSQRWSLAMSCSDEIASVLNFGTATATP